eukprot:SAG31_NODE_1130_length_9750_cov_9.716299_4_plen_65_part_00
MVASITVGELFCVGSTAAIDILYRMRQGKVARLLELYFHPKILSPCDCFRAANGCSHGLLRFRS